MKTIKKLKNNMKTVAGSALLVGATLTAGAAAVSAQDGGSSGDLGDYPAPFVSEDGEVDTSVVVGETAVDGEPVSTQDVVSAVEIAGSLGNAAFQETEQGVTVQGAQGWTASNGIVLNRENSNLYAYDPANAQISVAEAGDFNALQDVEFENQNDDTVQVEHEVEASDVPQAFDSSARGLDDPALYADLNGRTRTNVDATSPSTYAMSLLAEFNDNTVDFTSGDMNGEEIQMFGQTFTVDADESSSESAIVLYGDSQTFTVNRGESNTITVDGNDHEFRIENVDSSGGTREATIRVDGNLRSVEESDTVRVSGNDVRVRNIYNYQDGDGVVEFGVGSDELILENGKSVERDGETVRGTDVSLEGGVSSTSSIQIAVGPESRDDEALMPGDSYQDQVFGVAELHYGGLNADAAQNPAETLDVENSMDDSQITFTSDDGNEMSVTYAYDDNGDTNSDGAILASDTDQDVATHEGQELTLDDYFVLNVDERSDLFQVTDVTHASTSSNNGDDSTVEFENVETGSTIELDSDDFQQDATGINLPGYETESSGSEGYAEFRHNRQDYVAVVSSGDNVKVMRQGTSELAVYPNLYTDTNHGVTFTAPADVGTLEDPSGVASVRLPSTKSSSDATASPTPGTPTAFSTNGGLTYSFGHLPIEDSDYTASESIDSAGGGLTVELFSDDGDTSSPGVEIEVLYADGTTDSGSIDEADGSTSTASNSIDLKSGTAIGYALTTNNGDVDEYLEIEGNQVEDDLSSPEGTPDDTLRVVEGGDQVTRPSAAVIQPEDDNDEEHSFVFTPQEDDSSEIGSLDVAYTGSSGSSVDFSSEDAWVTENDDSGDNNLGYTTYGTYTDEDIDSDQESISLGLVNAQSTSGFALTGADGELSTSASGGDQTFSTSTPTYQFANGGLDTDENIGDSPDENVILVGGPAVNSLVADLASQGDTMARDEYTEGQGVIDMVPGAFGDNDALVVAGYSGEDTRAAGEFLADYRDHQSDLEGRSEVTISTETGSVVQ